jgi:Family of unknown function (DUF5989)
MPSNEQDRPPASQFVEQARQRRRSAIGELFDFLRTNAKWWLTPIVILLLLVGALVILGSTAAAPFIYTFF